jgi:WD40 repeat protein
VAGCAISADGHIVLTASGDGTLRVWDARDGRPLCGLAVEAPLIDGDCSANAERITAVGDNYVYLLQLKL